MRDNFNSYRMGERFPPSPGQPVSERERYKQRVFAEERIALRKQEDFNGLEVDLIVTAYEGVEEYLYSLGISSRNGVARYAKHDDIEGRFIAGQVPFYMATLARAVLYVGMRIPREWKGQDLSIEDVRSLHPQLGIYKAERVSAAEMLGGDEPADLAARAPELEPEESVIIPINPKPACAGTRKRCKWSRPIDVGGGEQEQSCAHCDLVRRTSAATLAVLSYRREA